MPPSSKFTREEIIHAALDVIRTGGPSAMTARAVGEALRASSKVIFSAFDGMEALRRDVIQAANGLYCAYLQEDIASGQYPPYKASGMSYIRFALEEKELFKLLFMRDRSQEVISPAQDDALIQPVLEIIMQNTGLSEERARLFHLEMWLFVHGIATMMATSYLVWDMALVSDVLTDGYQGLLHRFCPERSPS